MVRTPLVAAAIAAAALIFAVPAAASPCDAGSGWADIEYALAIAGAPSAPTEKSACPDEDEDGVCDDVCLDVDGDGWCDQEEPGEGEQPPDPSGPEPYQPDCDIIQDECHDGGCFPQPTFEEYVDCMNACMARVGC